MAKSLGANGIAIGALNEDHSLPLTTLKNWVRMAQPLDLTFHRAFDRVVQPKESLKKIMDLGFDGVLTSGQRPKATEGLDLLVELKNIAKDELVVMPGVGSTTKTANFFLKQVFEKYTYQPRDQTKQLWVKPSLIWKSSKRL